MGEERKIEFLEKIMETYTPPAYRGTSFNCPHCHALAPQSWEISECKVSSTHGPLHVVEVALCRRCNEYSVWQDEKIVYPKVLAAPLPHEDMPEDVKKTYEEARRVAEEASWAAYYLLEAVVLKELMHYILEEKGNLYNRIKNVKRSEGVPEEVISRLHLIKIDDRRGMREIERIDRENRNNKKMVDELFRYINFIVEKVTTWERQENSDS